MFNIINLNHFLNIQEDTAMKQDKNRSIDTPLKNRLDWVTTIIPFVTILALCSLFMIFPDASSQVYNEHMVYKKNNIFGSAKTF